MGHAFLWRRAARARALQIQTAWIKVCHSISRLQSQISDTWGKAGTTDIVTQEQSKTSGRPFLRISKWTMTFGLHYPGTNNTLIKYTSREQEQLLILINNSKLHCRPFATIPCLIKFTAIISQLKTLHKKKEQTISNHENCHPITSLLPHRGHHIHHGHGRSGIYEWN